MLWLTRHILCAVLHWVQCNFSCERLWTRFFDCRASYINWTVSRYYKCNKDTQSFILAQLSFELVIVIPRVHDTTGWPAGCIYRVNGVLLLQSGLNGNSSIASAVVDFIREMRAAQLQSRTRRRSAINPQQLIRCLSFRSVLQPRRGNVMCSTLFVGLCPSLYPAVNGNNQKVANKLS